MLLEKTLLPPYLAIRTNLLTGKTSHLSFLPSYPNQRILFLPYRTDLICFLELGLEDRHQTMLEFGPIEKGRDELDSVDLPLQESFQSCQVVRVVLHEPAISLTFVPLMNLTSLGFTYYFNV